jgi:hypothetical protein
VGIFIDHVMVLILYYLTARSLCSCKCVYRSWNHLISDADYRKELPQIDATFFYRTEKGKCHFTNITDEHPSLSFFPFPIQDVVVSDCYSGLILYYYFGCRYVVCNPTTNKWLLLLVTFVLVARLAWGSIQ